MGEPFSWGRTCKTVSTTSRRIVWIFAATIVEVIHEVSCNRITVYFPCASIFISRKRDRSTTIILTKSKRSRNKVSNTVVVLFTGVYLRRGDIPVIHRYPYSR